MLLCRILLLIAAILAAPTAIAQTLASAPGSALSDAAVATFDVASVRENPSVGGRNHIVSSPHDSHFTTVNAPLKFILEFAYGIPQSQIVNAPAWLDSVRFDIEAKADSSVDDQMHALTSDEGKLRKRRMVQALLADRFRLKAHQETRQLPVYALVVAKGGFKVTPSQQNGTTINASNGHVNVQGSDHTVDLFARELAQQLGRVIVDKTGIDGRYDITLRWTPDDRPTPMLNGTPDPNAPPDIFAAIQEQLGLKLESTRGPVPVLVVDHIEMPSAN